MTLYIVHRSTLQSKDPREKQENQKRKEKTETKKERQGKNRRCFPLLKRKAATMSITLSIPIALSFLCRLPFLDIFFVFFLSDIVSFFTARGVSVAGGLAWRRGNQRAVCVFAVCVSSRCPSRLFSASRAFVASRFRNFVPTRSLRNDTSLLFPRPWNRTHRGRAPFGRKSKELAWAIRASRIERWDRVKRELRQFFFFPFWFCVELFRWSLNDWNRYVFARAVVGSQ